jgi:arylformamidase
MNGWMDITVPLDEKLPPWPGDAPFRREIIYEIGAGGSVYNLSRLCMSAHAGTHLDAPLHFIAGGASIDKIEAELLVGPAYVLDLSHITGHIEAMYLEGKVPAGALRLLIKTRNSAMLGDGAFHEGFTALTAPAAAFLAVSGVRLLGLDYYSIAPFDAPAEAHRAFLGAPGAAALENVDLSGAREGWYDLICLPLKVAGGEGAPARALIRRMKEREA